MAIHPNLHSMTKESLKEMLEVAEYCIAFDKSKDTRWPDQYGCYGYPAAILLLCIVDSIGTIIQKGGHDTTIHFQVLNNPKYYNLNLKQEELRIIEKEYRNRLTHNGHIFPRLILNIGEEDLPVLQQIAKDNYCLNLVPLLKITKKVVWKILDR